ncbi:sigma-54 interaction domain-containing protein [Caldithrix abyssi]
MEKLLQQFDRRLSEIMEEFRYFSDLFPKDHAAHDRLTSIFAALFSLQSATQKMLNQVKQSPISDFDQSERLYEMLYKNSLILTTETDKQKLLDLAIDSIIEMSGAQRGFLALIDEKQNYTIISSRKMDRQSIKSAKKKVSNTVIRRVLQNQKTIAFQKPTRQKELTDISSVLQKGSFPLICVPLFINDKIRGVIYLDQFTKDLSPAIIALVKNFVTQLSNFLHTNELLDQLKDRNRALEQQLKKQNQFGKIVCKSKAMLQVLQTINQVAATDVTVLIHGQTGTGKELVARAIHENSLRVNGPFIEVDCGALPPNIIESELFGYKRGAFTGANQDKMGLLESANGGTLFLDEINNLSTNFQVKLLRVLQQKTIRRLGDTQERKVDFRLIVASSTDLKEEMKKKRFREDLFYRINTISVFLPPLRERKEDIPVLVNHFIKRYSEKYNRPAQSFTADFLQALERYTWPGNIRELEHVIERAVVLSSRTVLNVTDLPEEIFGNQKEMLLSQHYESLDKFITEAKKMYIEKILKECQGKKVEAARRLKINRSYLFSLIKQLQIKI